MGAGMSWRSWGAAWGNAWARAWGFVSTLFRYARPNEFVRAEVPPPADAAVTIRLAYVDATADVTVEPLVVDIAGRLPVEVAAAVVSPLAVADPS